MSKVSCQIDIPHLVRFTERDTFKLSNPGHKRLLQLFRMGNGIGASLSHLCPPPNKKQDRKVSLVRFLCEICVSPSVHSHQAALGSAPRSFLFVFSSGTGECHTNGCKTAPDCNTHNQENAPKMQHPRQEVKEEQGGMHTRGKQLKWHGMGQ